MKVGTAWSAWLASAALTACASLDTEYGHRDGARPGTVAQVGSDVELKERLSDTCGNARSGSRLALIRYTGNSHLRWLAFPVPDGMEVQVGDKVSLDVNACRFAKVE